VAVRELERIGELDPTGEFTLRMVVSKGYYVRSLARDIGRGLGVPSVLSLLRRDASGVFTLEESIALADVSSERLLSLSAAAARALPVATLTTAGEVRARVGALLSDHDFAVPPEGGAPTAWQGAKGGLVAVGGRHDDGHPVVIRGFSPGSAPKG
jgi:tRNA pseudouridine55 synthase